MIPSVDNLNPTLQWIGENDITDLWTYLKSIDWSEHFLIGLVSFHLLCFCLIIISKRHSYFQYGLFLILYFSFEVASVLFSVARAFSRDRREMCCVMAGEIINKAAAENWRLFSKQQYFDSNGLFISIVFSGPILLNCVFILILWLLDAFNLLVKVKRREVIANQKYNKSDEKIIDNGKCKKNK